MQRTFGYEVPADLRPDDEIVIRCKEKEYRLGARIRQIVPGQSSGLQVRIKVFVSRIIDDALEELADKAKESLRGKGF